MANSRLVSSVFTTCALAGCLAAYMTGSVLSAQSVAVERAERNVPAARRASTVTLRLDRVPLDRALFAIAERAGVELGLNAETLPAAARVSIDVHGVPAEDAFAAALKGTGFRAEFVGRMVSIVSTGMAPTTIVQGSIVGKVVDAKTKQGLRGATVTLSGTSMGVTTREDGGFRMSGVTPRTYTIQTRLLGYTKASKTVTVVDGQTASVEIVMEPSVNALDQVVVTGTIVATAQREISNAITVITAKDIEQRGITQIDQLFRGDVPGLFAVNSGTSSGAFSEGDPLGQVVMYSRGATQLVPNTPSTMMSSTGGAALKFTGYSNAIKTYVDGIELVDPGFLSQIDPKTIERIEIVTGPQASTIYGSNAINGVMQIFTKRGGASRARLTLSLQSGFVEKNVNNALTPQHDYSGQISGVEGRLSYNVNAGWNRLGRWTPSRQTTKLMGGGGVRMENGPLTGDASFSLRNQNTQSNGQISEYAVKLRGEGIWPPQASNGVTAPSVAKLDGMTYGATLTYAPWAWWSHELVVGNDVENSEIRKLQRGYTQVSDTMLSIVTSQSNRRSLRYVTTFRTPVGTLAKATVTAGADGWKALYNAMYNGAVPVLSGTLTGTPVTLRRPDHNAGVFMQTMVGVREVLFLSYGLRAEWNPSYGDDVGALIAPRYGATATQDFGPLTVKLRTSYGRSTRPPTFDITRQLTWFENYASSSPAAGAQYQAIYGGKPYRLASPDLKPESQRGWESGLDVFVGSRSSLTITLYDQTVDDLITSMIVDSSRSAAPNPASLFFRPGTTTIWQDEDGYGYAAVSQYLNAAQIRNRGWELNGTLTTGPFTTRGTYSWTKSRIVGIVDAVKSYIPSSGLANFTPGATFNFLPEHTWALGTTYATNRSTVTLNLNGTGYLTRDSDALNLSNSSLRLATQAIRYGAPVGYRPMSAGYVMADMNASRRFSTKVEGILQIRNLGDLYRNDYGVFTPTLGRQTKVGVRISN